MEITKTETMEGIDPFINCVTLASLCHLVFRRNFMIPKTIALINVNRFGPRQCSLKSKCCG
jgi:hypothetical protein